VGQIHTCLAFTSALASLPGTQTSSTILIPTNCSHAATFGCGNILTTIITIVPPVGLTTSTLPVVNLPTRTSLRIEISVSLDGNAGGGFGGIIGRGCDRSSRDGEQGSDKQDKMHA
jgi:hypothetical protein